MCAPFSIDNHALLFGALAKAALESGLAGAEEALTAGVVEYARERGGRMRQRCDRLGDPADMLSYKAYCEWRPEDEVMESVTVQKSPVNRTKVTACRWIEVWRECGYLKYGRYYCDHVDENLVKGFNADLRLEIGRIMSRGDEACDFTWCGADLTPR